MSILLSTIRNILHSSDQGLVDDREPLLTVAIPGLEGLWGLYAPNFSPWKNLAIVSKRTIGVVLHLYILFLMVVNLPPTFKDYVDSIHHPMYLCCHHLLHYTSAAW